MQHPTAQELLMSLEGELSRRRTAHVKRHLDSCWECRERVRTSQETIVEFMRARRVEATVPAPEGPRALLRAQLAAQARAPRGRGWVWGVASAGAACCSAVVVAVVFILNLSSNANAARPDSRFTPGETRPVSLTNVCRNREAQVIVRDIPEDVRRQVFRRYGVAMNRQDEYEVDYLITPDLGGADTVRNLWPQPYSVAWNARMKDGLEQKLHDLVCTGAVDLVTAQKEIASDWIGTYRKYMAPGAVR